MSVITDAIFFLHKDEVLKQMLVSEFEALLDGVVQATEYSAKSIDAVFLQINSRLSIQSLVFFRIGFTPDGYVVGDWHVPFHQLLQSPARGPDLGAGVCRLVTKAQCSAPWLAQGLYDPDPKIFTVLVQSVKLNKLGIVEAEDTWQGDDIPTLASSPKPPPVLAQHVPTLSPQAADIPVAVPVASDPEPAEAISEEEALANKTSAENENASAAAKLEFEAMKQALTIKMARLQKDYDALKDSQQQAINHEKEMAQLKIDQLLDRQTKH